MKRILFAVLGTVLGLVALLSFKTEGKPLATPAGGLPSANAAAATPTSTPAPSTPTSTPAGASPDPSSSTTTPTATSTRYVGSAVETRYGIVQVAVKVTGRHIDSVSFVQLTAFDRRSQEINAEAGPTLLQETVDAQSSNIDSVSGASYTSDGYLQSLQSALDQAGIT